MLFTPVRERRAAHGLDWASSTRLPYWPTGSQKGICSKTVVVARMGRSLRRVSLFGENLLSISLSKGTLIILTVYMRRDCFRVLWLIRYIYSVSSRRPPAGHSEEVEG